MVRFCNTRVRGIIDFSSLVRRYKTRSWRCKKYSSIQWWTHLRPKQKEPIQIIAQV